MINPRYAKQAALVIKTLPHIATEECFALKGGTAINLFELDLPRLSVDIDLTYTPISNRDKAVSDINAALERIASRLNRFGIESCLTGTNVSRKILCFTSDATIKIEPNFILRGTIFPTRKLANSPRSRQLFGEAIVNILSQAELYGGKICAALDRQHPRDLFDITQFYKSNKVTEEIKKGFLALALCHNRPLHELLNPILQDHKELYEQQFAGMTDTPFSYEEHKETFRRLRDDILGALTSEDKQHLLNFVSLDCDPKDFNIPNLTSLPALAWKQRNLVSLKATNPAKFASQRTELSRLFE